MYKFNGYFHIYTFSTTILGKVTPIPENINSISEILPISKFISSEIRYTFPEIKIISFGNEVTFYPETSETFIHKISSYEWTASFGKYLHVHEIPKKPKISPNDNRFLFILV